jgi:sodium/potassium-transporting ATPase subunit alpha
MLIAIFFLYPKRFQDVLATAPIPAMHWFIPLGFGVAVLFLDELRKFMVRRYPEEFIARIAW